MARGTATPDTVAAPRVVSVTAAPCRVEGLDDEVRCATVTVPEDRTRPPAATPDYLTVPLRVLILPATGPSPASDPIVVLQGGPGQAASDLASFYGGESWQAARALRDIVLIDQRGTGGSRPLDCWFGGSDNDPQGYFDGLFPVGAVRACYDELRQRADLGRYTTIDAARDIEAVRRALSLGRINLYGTSYGTRLAQAYWRLYPDAVRSAVLKGVVPPELVAPVPFAADAQRALEQLAARCRASVRCARATPDLAAAVDSLLDLATPSPLRMVVVVDSSTGRRAALRVPRDAIATALRSLLQSPTSAVRIPGLVRQALDGDPAPLARTILDLQRGAARALYEGMRLTVLCAEDAPRMAATARPAGDGFLGDYWIAQVTRACSNWRVPTVPESLFTPPAGVKVPLLLISGELDPATPPRWADSLARRLPWARHVVVANTSHSFALMRGCVDRLIAEFYRAADASSLDASCADSIEPAPFPE